MFMWKNNKIRMNASLLTHANCISLLDKFCQINTWANCYVYKIDAEQKWF